MSDSVAEEAVAVEVTPDLAVLAARVEKQWEEMAEPGVIRAETPFPAPVPAEEAVAAAQVVEQAAWAVAAAASTRSRRWMYT